MSLAPPSSYDDDDEAGDQDNDDSTAEQPPAEDRPGSAGRDSAVAGAGGPSTEALQQAIERNAAAIEAKADDDLVRDLLRQLDELQTQVTDLEDNHDVMHNYLLDLEDYRGELLDTIDLNEETVTQLVAAVFDDDPECPECEDGHLIEANSLMTKHLVCSNENCEFQREIALL